MRYFGSKVSTVERIYDLVSARAPAGSFCDAFGGIATVGSYFKARGYSVWTGDILTSAYCFQVARVKLDRTPSFRKLRKALNLQRAGQVIDSLNCQHPIEGWLTNEYARKRKFFTSQNAGRIEACRVRIIEWFRQGWITQNERAVLLASLVNSMDRVANTAGTYYAYLKTWHRKAVKPFRFELLQSTRGIQNCYCFLSEASDLVGMQEFDVLYLDPPFNERSFARYYHLPESLARCQTPRVRGQSGIPLSMPARSDFNRPAVALTALERLLDCARFKLLVFHYSDNGLIPKREIRYLLRSLGKTEEFLVDSKGYTTTHTPRVMQHRIYLVQNA